KILDHLIRQCDALVDFLLNDLCPDIGRPWIIQMLRYVHEPSVIDCIMSIIFHSAGYGVRHARQQRFEKVAEEGVVEILVGLLERGDEPRIVQGATDLLTRLVDDSLVADDGALLFSNLDWDTSPLTRMIELIKSGTAAQVDACVGVLGAVVCGSTTKAIGTPPAPDPPIFKSLKTVGVKVVAGCMADVCGVLGRGEQRATLSVPTRVKLLDIVAETVRLVDGDKFEDVVSYLPWPALSGLFFGRLRSSSMYQTAFFKLVHAVVHRGNEEVVRR
ncbi:hypothetical protein HK104_007285, partial [Borealophlyctis nickersoniae]